MRRYSVVRTFEGRYGHDKSSLGGIFRHREQAIKERNRRNARDPLVTKRPEDLLHRWRPDGNEPYQFPQYRWRVLDLGSRRWADQ